MIYADSCIFKLKNMNELIITLEEGKKINAEYKGHNMTTDQPEKSGGDNSAPSPFDFFLASLGTCAGFYVKMFCEQRQIDTSGIKIIQSMEHDKETRLISRINLDIQVPDSFPEKYKAAVIKAADQCAVKRHLQAPPVINTVVTHAN